MVFVFTTGTVNSPSNRTLKNRLYQRALRERRLANELAKGIVRRPRGRPKGSLTKRDKYGRHSALSDEGGGSKHHSPCSDATCETKKRRVSPVCHSENHCFLCEVDGFACLEFVNRLDELIRRGALPGHPLSDRLLSLTQYNLLRALMSNMESIGLSVFSIKECDRLSPFSDASMELRLIPHSLRPTALQRKVAHHPWIDIFPIPALRDALLMHQGEYDAAKLCNDITGKCGTDYAGEVGLVVWLEPSDPKGWEVKESFAKEWSWLLESCDDLKTSTNYWRSRRGDPPLFSARIENHS